MLKTYQGQKFILCMLHEVTNYVITIPIHHSGLEVIGDALIDNIPLKYCIPDYIILDQDSAFISSLTHYLLKKFDLAVAPTIINH